MKMKQLTQLCVVGISLLSLSSLCAQDAPSAAQPPKKLNPNPKSEVAYEQQPVDEQLELEEENAEAVQEKPLSGCKKKKSILDNELLAKCKKKKLTNSEGEEGENQIPIVQSFFA